MGKIIEDLFLDSIIFKNKTFFEKNAFGIFLLLEKNPPPQWDPHRSRRPPVASKACESCWPRFWPLQLADGATAFFWFLSPGYIGDFLVFFSTGAMFAVGFFWHLVDGLWKALDTVILEFYCKYWMLSKEYFFLISNRSLVLSALFSICFQEKADPKASTRGPSNTKQAAKKTTQKPPIKSTPCVCLRRHLHFDPQKGVFGGHLKYLKHIQKRIKNMWM